MKDVTSSVVVAVSKPADDCSAIYRSATHPDELVEVLLGSHASSCWDIFQIGVRTAPEKPFLGSREVLSKEDGTLELGDYKWITYKEGMEIAIIVGSALVSGGYVQRQYFPSEVNENARCMQLLGMYCKNCQEWFLCEQAANAFNITLVPLYDTLAPDAVLYILQFAGIATVFSSPQQLKSLLDAKRRGAVSLKTVILNASENETAADDKATAEELGVSLVSWQTLLEFGREHRLEPCAASADDTATICFTSGTTGNPKGVIVSHRNFVSCVCAAIRGPMGDYRVKITPDEVHISYLPLAHCFERIICNIAFAKGARIGVYSGTTSGLMDDIRVLQPTVFVSVPRVYHRINDKVDSKLREKNEFTQSLFRYALNCKLDNLKRTGTVQHLFWDKTLFGHFRNLLGGRVRYLIVGGAAMDAKIADRIQVLFSCPMVEGYGLTETLGASFVSLPKGCAGDVGAPLPCIEYKLRSVPEMNYLCDDEPPRGEVLMRGPSVSTGYFLNLKETKESFSADGWLFTGDIGTVLPCGSLRLIDRKKAIFKLAQGEYVAPEQIEGTYAQASLVNQIFVFGYPTKHCLVGVVVPDEDAALAWADAHSFGGGRDLKEYCRNVEFKDDLFAEMAAVAKDLNGFQKVQKITLVSEPFSFENNLLTPTFKLKRLEAFKVYKPLIDEMYFELEVEQAAVRPPCF